MNYAELYRNMETEKFIEIAKTVGTEKDNYTREELLAIAIELLERFF